MAHILSIRDNRDASPDCMPLVLDPWISYDSMKTDYANDPILVDHLEQSKLNLVAYFNEHYANKVISTPSSVPSVQSPPVVGSPQKSFTAQYCRKEKTSIEEYFKLSAEDFDTCNPIQWWMG
jgi:hypothetical protein